MPESVAGIELPEGDPGSVESAANGLRRAGGGFEQTGGVADRAAAQVPDWTGHAAITFHDRCGDYRSAAAAADAACSRAAAAVRQFAGDLTEARERVKLLQTRGEECVERIQANERSAAEAGLRAEMASRMAFQASFGAGADAGALVAEYTRQADNARDEQVAAAGKAQEARDELDRLREKADEQRELVRDAGRRAARQVDAAGKGLPTVTRPAYGSSAFALRSEGTGSSTEYGAFFVRFGEGQSALVEYNTDGSVSITTSESVQLGLGGSLGGRVSFGSNKPVIVGRDLHAAALTQLEKGRTYVFPTHGAAREYIDEVLGRDDDDGGFFLPIAMIQPPFVGKGTRFDDVDPKTSYFQGGFKLEAGATLSRGNGGGSISGEAREAIGHSEDHVSGNSTHYFKTGAAGSVELSLLTAGVSERRDGEAVTAVTYDPNGEPVHISFSSTSATTGSLSLEGDVRDMSQMVKKLDKAAFLAEASQGTRVEVQTQLDVGRDGSHNSEVVRRYLDGGDPDAARELVEVLERDAQIDVRVYDVEASSAGPDIEGGGAKVKVQVSESSASLREAYTRPPGDLRFHELQVP
jgi:hypothetical protein